MQRARITRRALKILIFSYSLLSEASENKGTIEHSLKDSGVESANFWPFPGVGFPSGTFWIFRPKLFPENCISFTVLHLSAKELRPREFIEFYCDWCLQQRSHCEGEKERGYKGVKGMMEQWRESRKKQMQAPRGYRTFKAWRKSSTPSLGKQDFPCGKCGLSSIGPAFYKFDRTLTVSPKHPVSKRVSQGASPSHPTRISLGRAESLQQAISQLLIYR